MAELSQRSQPVPTARASQPLANTHFNPSVPLSLIYLEFSVDKRYIGRGELKPLDRGTKDLYFAITYTNNWT